LETYNIAVTGNFNILVPEEQSSLLFSLEGYIPVTVRIGQEREIKITLLPGTEQKDEDVYLIYGKQKRSQITSAISTVNGTDLEEIPITYQNAAVTGLLTGILTIQERGAPGGDNADIYMRGRRSWNNRNPIIYVDGHRRDFSLVDPHEIEQISVYKDAGALAIFGLRGGNGALMATTRRGKEGKPKLKLNAQVSMQQPTQKPDFLDAYNYALLHNEAMRNDFGEGTELYDDEMLEHYRTGDDPLHYPDVDWVGTFLKPYTISQKYNLSVEGGTSKARYFVNMSVQNNNGLYHTEKGINTYNTNANFTTYSIRSNVDVNLTDNLSMAVNLFGRQQRKKNPGGDGDNLFNTLYSLRPNIFPVHYGTDKVAGSNEQRNNPFGILNYSGYQDYTHTTTEASLNMTEKLGFITEGLSMYGSIAWDARYDNTVDRTKSYQVWQLVTDPVSGKDTLTAWGELAKQKNDNSFGSRKVRIFDVEFGLHYNRHFGKHQVTSSLVINRNQESDDTQNLPNYHEGIFGRANYTFASKYMAEFSFGWQGSEQLPEENRYGFFPAVSAGWIISEESFIKNNIGNILSFMKIRGSYGLAGNDDGIPYFYYLPGFKNSNNARYNFGTTPVSVAGWIEDGLFNPDVTWEQSLKTNIGADIGLFKNILSVGFNYFKEETTQILTEQRSVSTLLGIGASTGPRGNVGETLNEGFEGEWMVNHHIGKFNWFVGGNFCFAHNEIVFNDEQKFEYDYRKTVGKSINNLTDLYLTDGLYQSEQDILNSPKTTFSPPKVGDIKYRDLNGDGTVDINDRITGDLGNLGELSYAAFIGFKCYGVDFRAMFTGIGRREYYTSGISIIAFTNTLSTGGGYEGNVRQYHLDHRFNPQDPATWETASYPRLSVSGANHNTQRSDFWTENGAFLRLKTLELGYTLPVRWTRHAFMSQVRIFYSGYNLFTWHHMKTVDPESLQGGNAYPLQKISSFGLNIQF
jgi:TonB-linked SusC/RagA family outer membrane protein